MFTTGSKLLIGSSVFAMVAAVVYGVTQNEALGIVGLVSAACALAFLAGVNVWAGDSNLSALDATAVATSEASDDPPGASIWPMVFAVGAAAVLLGLVTQQSIFTIGLVILLAAGAQWAVQAWAESASTDSTTNAAVRGRLANPLEYPLLGAVAVGGIAYALSRIMLWLSKDQHDHCLRHAGNGHCLHRVHLRRPPVAQAWCHRRRPDRWCRRESLLVVWLPVSTASVTSTSMRQSLLTPHSSATRPKSSRSTKVPAKPSPPRPAPTQSR